MHEDYKHLECEANGHTIPTASTNHVHVPRGYDVRKVHRLMKIIEREALDQLEPGQNF